MKWAGTWLCAFNVHHKWAFHYTNTLQKVVFLKYIWQVWQPFWFWWNCYLISLDWLFMTMIIDYYFTSLLKWEVKLTFSNFPCAKILHQWAMSKSQWSPYGWNLPLSSVQHFFSIIIFTFIHKITTSLE